MRKSTLDLLLDNLANLSNRIHAIETAFIDFSEENPKSSGQWVEERLRALEAQVKEDKFDYKHSDEDDEDRFVTHANFIASKVTALETKFTNIPDELKALQNDHSVLFQRFEAVQAKAQREDPWQKIGTMHQQLEKLETWVGGIQQGVDSRITRLENTVVELGLALRNLSKELQDMKNV